MKPMLFAFLILFVSIVKTAAGVAPAATWQAGVARAVITPEHAQWMAGYGSRSKPAQGKEHDLWIKVLVLQDADGKRAVVLTSDLLGFPRSIYDNVCDSLKEKFGFDRAAIMLTASHTHCGPVLRGALLDIYPIDAAQRALIESYSAKLEAQIVTAVGQALAGLKPVKLSIGSGTARFAVNRRTNSEPKVPDLIAAKALKGPVDHSVPVLAARTADGKLLAVVFMYACHNTVLDFYRWCGDYAGFAQLTLEQRHPEMQAMFAMGCGADQNPLPRRSVALAQRYGNELADAVDDVLRQSLATIEPKLDTAFEFVSLNLGDAPTRQQLAVAAAGKPDYIQRWSARLLHQLDEGKPFARSYRYPVQAWRLGDKQLWISLGGEVVVDYSLRIKKELGNNVWITGYANDVMAYIPSLRVLKEGGYEGQSSMMVYGMPANRWAPDVEETIMKSVHRAVQSIGWSPTR